MSSSVAATSARFRAETRLARRAHRTRSRSIAWGEIVAVVLIAVALVVATLLSSSHVAGDLSSERIHVEGGQTLWSLATEHPVAGLSTEQVADLIARSNHLEDGQLAIGSTIQVPVEADTSLMVASR